MEVVALRVVCGPSGAVGAGAQAVGATAGGELQVAHDPISGPEIHLLSISRPVAPRRDDAQRVDRRAEGLRQRGALARVGVGGGPAVGGRLGRGRGWPRALYLLFVVHRWSPIVAPRALPVGFALILACKQYARG